MTPEEQTAAESGTPAQTTPEALTDAQKAYKGRDEAKRRHGLVLAALGIDPAEVKLVPTGDPAQPYKIESPTLSELAVAAKALKGGQSEYEAKEKELREANGRTVAAYEKWVDGQAVDTELRNALSMGGAIDVLGSGKYEDVLPLVRSQIKVSRAIDQVTGELVVKVSGVNAKGEPIEGDDAVQKVVAEFLEKRPALRKATAARGPGAGGYGAGTAKASGTMPAVGTTERGQVTADMMFGKQRSFSSAADAIFGKTKPYKNILTPRGR